MSFDVGITIFRALTTLCRGPCRLNQAFLTKTSLAPALALLHAVQTVKTKDRQLQEKESKRSAEQVLTLEWRLLEICILEFLLSLVEGAHVEAPLRLLEAGDLDILFFCLSTNASFQQSGDQVTESSFSRVEHQIEELAAESSSSKLTIQDSMTGSSSHTMELEGQLSLKSKKKGATKFDKRTRESGWRAAHHRPSDEFVLIYTLLAILSQSTSSKAAISSSLSTQKTIARRFSRWKQAKGLHKSLLVRHIARVEYLQDGVLQELFFKIPLAFANHRNAPELVAAQLELLYSCSRSSPEDKLVDFLKGIEHLVKVAEHEEALAHVACPGLLRCARATAPRKDRRGKR